MNYSEYLVCKTVEFWQFVSSAEMALLIISVAPLLGICGIITAFVWKNRGEE